MATNMKINTPKGWSSQFSTNSSRASSVLSNISSVIYAKQVKALANNITQADQVELSGLQELALSYISAKIGDNIYNNKTVAKNPMPKPHSNDVDSIYLPQDIETTSIPYSTN